VRGASGVIQVTRRAPPDRQGVTGRGTVVTGRIVRKELIQPITMEEKG
jgi:hypothetical protein